MKDVKSLHSLATDDYWPFMPFGVRVGDGGASFFVIPKDLRSRPTLRLVETTLINDPKYEDLPLY